MRRRDRGGLGPAGSGHVRPRTWRRCDAADAESLLPHLSARQAAQIGAPGAPVVILVWCSRSGLNTQTPTGLLAADRHSPSSWRHNDHAHLNFLRVARRAPPGHSGERGQQRCGCMANRQRPAPPRFLCADRVGRRGSTDVQGPVTKVAELQCSEFTASSAAVRSETNKQKILSARWRRSLSPRWPRSFATASRKLRLDCREKSAEGVGFERRRGLGRSGPRIVRIGWMSMIRSSYAHPIAARNARNRPDTTANPAPASAHRANADRRTRRVTDTTRIGANTESDRNAAAFER